jgi:AraC-like DNA-binding protein
MKNPQLFASPQRADESIRVIHVDESYTGCSWHFHPELQLCHVSSGEGQRLIGDQLCPIETGEVVLLGSNLPHVWKYDSNERCPIQATVVHFDASVLGSDWFDLPEIRDVRLLLKRASHGLQATGELRKRLAGGIEELQSKEGLPRVICLLEMLHWMTRSNELESICSAGVQAMSAQLEFERLRRACDYIEEHSHKELSRDAVAEAVHMSGSGFSRFFKARTGMTFKEYVVDVRISRACHLLASTNLSVTEVALECGFGELTTFNRAFRKCRGKTPTQYRSLVHSIAN